MDKTDEGLSAPGATVSRFVDWCGAEEALRRFATTSLTNPLVIAGAPKSGRSMLLRHVLPGAIKTINARDRFLVLPVDWSFLKGARDFATVFCGFQTGVGDALCRVGLHAPAPVAPTSQGVGSALDTWLAQVESICVTRGYRPIHLWDEAEFLFTFDVRPSSLMYAALRPALLPMLKTKSVYAMTGTASQMLLRVIADQPPHGSCPWNHTHRIVIPSPHPDYDRVEVERAAQQALDLFYREHPERVVRCAVPEIKKHWKDDVVITPALAVEVARTMPAHQHQVDVAAHALQHKMDTVRRTRVLAPAGRVRASSVPVLTDL